MTHYVFSKVAGSSLSFKYAKDQLLFDLGPAGDLKITESGADLVLSLQGQSVTLLGTALGRLSTGNLTFADGSKLLIGDNTTATSADNAANTLTGTAYDDMLVGMGGNDTLNGAGGSDTYLVRGTGDGADVYRDTGTSGIDRIVAGSNGAVITLAGTFNAAGSGIEQISGNGFTGVKIAGGGKNDTLDFTGVELSGIAQIDAGAGADKVTGSAAADTIHGGAGNDAIDGGGGNDVAVFDGLKAGYRITTAGGVTTVVDLAPKTNGNDGTDTLRNVEVLRFADGDVVLGAGPAAKADGAAAQEDGAPVAIDVLANDTGSGLKVTGISATGLQGQVSIDAGGTGLTYAVGTAFQSLAQGQQATETFSYTVTDGSGATADAQVTVTVTGTNDGPGAAADAAGVLADGGPAAIDVLANDSDSDAGDTLTIVGAAIVAGAGTLTTDGATLTFDPGSAFASLAAGETTPVEAVYIIADSTGATSTATVTVTVTGVNDGPNAANDGADAVADSGPVTIDVLANDSDVDNGDSLTIVDAAIVAGGGWLSTDGATLTFDTSYDFAGLAAGEATPVEAVYTIADSTGATSTATLTITVTGVNDGPTASDDAVTVDSAGGAVPIDVLANDWDIDNGDVLSLVSAELAPGQGTLSIVDNMLVFDPGQDFAYLAAGETAFASASYTIQDSAGATSTAWLDIAVTGSAGGGGGPSPFTVIDPAQAAANAGGIVNSILGSTPGITVDPNSLAITAGPSSAMFYDGSLAKLGIGPGLLITSGTVPGTENTVGYFGVDNNMPGDPALDAVVNTVFSTASYDASSITFSFDVTDPSLTGIKFNAVFGSDEFPEWVDAFVDIGVVLVNGVNVAYFNNDPMAPLSVIGSNLSSSYFNDNTANLDTSSFGGIAVPGVPSTYPIEYDGISNVLSIMAPVHLGTNTITIAIADTGDHIYDSGLFISNLTATDVPTTGVVVDQPCTEGADDKSGSSAAEIFDAKGGDDTIAADGGNDVVLGGDGNDSIDGGADDDFVNGGTGDDTVIGGAGNDHLDGGTGNDAVSFSGVHTDYQVHQIGVDQYEVTDLRDGAPDGTDIVSGFEAAVFAGDSFDFAALVDAGTVNGATIAGTADDDIINETATVAGQPLATALNDVVHAGAGDDIVSTGAGDDTLFGEGGNDDLNGGAGSDVIVSGSGHDDLTGGLGADRFVFGTAGDVLSTAANPDKIVDFSSAQGDRIDLSAIDAIFGTPEDDAFTLVAGFTGVAGQLVVANSGTEDLVMMGDMNGDAVADFAIKLQNLAALNAGDIWA